MDETCRICLSNGRDYLSLFEENRVKKLKSCSSIKTFSFPDNYPTKICSTCSIRLEDAFKLRSEIQCAEETLSRRASLGANKGNNELIQSEGSKKENIEEEETVDRKLHSPVDSDIIDSHTGAEENDQYENNACLSNKSTQRNRAQKFSRKQTREKTRTNDKIRAKRRRVKRERDNHAIKLEDGHEIVTTGNDIVQYSQIEEFLEFSDEKLTKKDAKLSKKYKREEKICETCGKVLSSHTALRMHMASIHTMDLPEIRCITCLKQFKTQYVLNAHIRHSHSPEKQRFNCDICGSTFNRKGDVKQHKKRHLSVRPYSCELCDKRFIAKHYLTKHMRSHTGEAPYKCEFCSRSFTVRWNLSQHQRQHTLVTPYKCQYCQLEFRYNVTLKSHIKSVHVVQLATDHVDGLADIKITVNNNEILENIE